MRAVSELLSRGVGETLHGCGEHRERGAADEQHDSRKQGAETRPRR